VQTASAPVAPSSPSVVLPTIAPTGSIFYGINGHNTANGPYDISVPELQLSQLKNLGVTLYRNNVNNVDDAIKLSNMAQMMQASGVTVYPVILMTVFEAANEDDAYQSAYTAAQEIVRVQRYSYYEVTNELAAQCLTGNVDGVRSTDFDNQRFQIARGVIRGMIAGIKSVDPHGKIVIGGNTWMHYGFDVMLANGTQPDGTSGHPVVTWDVTAWHWYSEQGDIRHTCGGTGCYNVIGTLASFGKPIWINEVGMRPWFAGTAEESGGYLANGMIGALLAIAPQYNIQSLQVYQLYDDPATGEGPYGIMLNDGRTPKPAYAAVRNFIARHPKRARNVAIARAGRRHRRRFSCPHRPCHWRLSA
jgi:hypothetical protein